MTPQNEFIEHEYPTYHKFEKRLISILGRTGQPFKTFKLTRKEGKLEKVESFVCMFS